MSNQATAQHKAPLFSMGQVVATPAALERLTELNTEASELLQRHLAGDWGDLHDDDCARNDAAVHNGSRIFSSYDIEDDKFWVITEADRSVTTVLTPLDY
ncbi:hypothetical protein [Methylophaga nitratireducenticrescens]|uniref:hypothetical protein n=1 Tax=Methylophaga nitratireducenticrescens TaxID=754476 RepID=UPI000CDCD14C|nr:hypothetical protein [Methylophaga nitratireducenticrescens]AUZ86181.1 hypothetical protein CDW43_16125 [Methylophaga nitratireducenticrescens]